MKKSKTKDKIYHASIELFLSQGFEHTTVDQITKKAGVSKGSFFNHFPTKDSIIFYLCEQKVLEMEERIKNELNQIENTRKKLISLFQLAAKMNEKDKEIVKLITPIIFSFSNQGMDVQVYHDFIQKTAEQILEEGKNKGVFLKETDIQQSANNITGVYFYTLFQWISDQLEGSFELILIKRIYELFNGLTIEREAFSMNSYQKQEQYDTIIVGGGLAGLSAAALLAKRGKKILLLERGNLGGRAVTLNIKDFKFNFGAHAIYGRDSSVLRKFENELGIRIGWRDFNPTKAKYDLGTILTDVPANVLGLFRTKVMGNASKIKFTFEVIKTFIGTEKGHPHISIKKWMEDRKLDEEVKEMMLTLASSNFFTREPDNIPSDVFFAYYKRLFTTNKPVAYIEGGWQALIDEFVRVIEENGGEIKTKEKVIHVKSEVDEITEVQTANGLFKADQFIFCIPPEELSKLFVETRIEHLLKHYAQYNPSFVLVYDIGLKERIETPYSYVYDKQNRMFITDISYYDETCVPENGQLLQAIAYINQDELGDKEKIEQYLKKIEQLFDKHFAGWREHLVVPRISKRAAAQEIKWTMNQKAMPISFPDYRNVFFAGDWCQGKGQLSELSFSSAYEASKLVLQKELVLS